MKPAPLPLNEPARVRALHELHLLDTPPHEHYDRVVRFVAEQFDAPIAMISLVDSDRQWLKARVGIDRAEIPRELSICAHAIAEHELFVVEDAARDERFAHHPMVIDGPRVRFYAGAPISAPNGEHIGTLCLLDVRPRRLDEVETAMLEALRDMVDDLIAGRKVDES